MRFGHGLSDRRVARFVRTNQSQRAKSAKKAYVKHNQNERDAPQGNLDRAFIKGARANWGGRIQAAESSIAGASFQQRGAPQVLA